MQGTSRCVNEKRDDTLGPRLYLMSSAQVQKTTLKTKLSSDHDYLHDKTNVNFLNSHFGSKTLKRSSHSQVELHAEPPQKRRATNNEGRYQRARVAYSSILPKQVDDVAISRDIQIEEYRGTSLNNTKSMFSITDKERKNHTDIVVCSCAENFERNDADEVSSSVCSCSINGCNLNKARYPLSAGLVEDLEGETSDAESTWHPRDEEGNDSLLSEEEMATEIHRLELHAYRCTIEALHASGPLSWELEALMTNLRLSLNISNDEHLMEIRNLISSENSMPVK